MGTRLREARELAGYGSAAAAAAALGVNTSTYRAHENGQNEFGPDEAATYARKFKTTAAYLLTGTSVDPATEEWATDVPVMGYVGAGAEVEPDFEQVPPDGLFQITVPFPMPADMIAYQVRGDSMLPQFQDGMIIVVFKEQRRSSDSFLGEEAVVRTMDGRRFVKTIERGPNGGYTLRSWNAKPIEGVALDWIGEIFTYLPAAALRREARRIDKQGGMQGSLNLRAG